MDHPIRKLAPSEIPPQLYEIPKPPKQLYIKGTMPPALKLLAVVGTRKYSQYGKAACEHLIHGLRDYPIAIVSGLALGIDSIAHRAALTAQIPTIAVPGSGLSERVLYPASHRSLAAEIVRSGGALLSEFDPEFRARPESFLQRNRIMAGLAQAVLVIEGTVQSGTMVTARLATEYNRDVLTVPGSIFSESSAGTHLLLSLGATPIRTADDIVQALHFEKETKHPTVSTNALSLEELRILELLAKPQPRDELIRTLGIETHVATALLMKLELEGYLFEQTGMLQRSYEN